MYLQKEFESHPCRLEIQIAELDNRAAQKDKERAKDREAIEGRRTLAEVNKLNAKRNMENALKNITSRPEGSRALTTDGVDPFSRRPTRPMNYWSTKRNIAGGRVSLLCAGLLPPNIRCWGTLLIHLYARSLTEELSADGRLNLCLPCCLYYLQVTQQML